jgi:hypothetical protein
MMATHGAGWGSRDPNGAFPIAFNVFKVESSTNLGNRD